QGRAHGHGDRHGDDPLVRFGNELGADAGHQGEAAHHGQGGEEGHQAPVAQGPGQSPAVDVLDPLQGRPGGGGLGHRGVRQHPAGEERHQRHRHHQGGGQGEGDGQGQIPEDLGGDPLDEEHGDEGGDGGESGGGDG